jgi:hypothetical protein
MGVDMKCERQDNLVMSLVHFFQNNAFSKNRNLKNIHDSCSVLYCHDTVYLKKTEPFEYKKRIFIMYDMFSGLWNENGITKKEKWGIRWSSGTFRYFSYKQLWE